MDVLSSPSLRLRGGVYQSDTKTRELNLCPSAMSPETKRLLPPTSETIMTKPFPVRGKELCKNKIVRASLAHIILCIYMCSRAKTRLIYSKTYNTVNNIRSFIRNIICERLFVCPAQRINVTFSTERIFIPGE